MKLREASAVLLIGLVLAGCEDPPVRYECAGKDGPGGWAHMLMWKGKPPKDIFYVMRQEDGPLAMTNCELDAAQRNEGRK